MLTDERPLKLARRFFLAAFYATASGTVGLGLVAIWFEVADGAVFMKLLGSAGLLMVVSALGVSVTRVAGEQPFGGNQ